MTSEQTIHYYTAAASFTDCPTSPWTELYQLHADSAWMAQMAMSADDQQPTHDALSDIYNPDVP